MQYKKGDKWRVRHNLSQREATVEVLADVNPGETSVQILVTGDAIHDFSKGAKLTLPLNELVFMHEEKKKAAKE